MTISTDGQICYGILFEEGYEFIWDIFKIYGSIVGLEDWWIYEICGYQVPFELINEEGEYITPKPSKEKIEKYYDSLYKFKEDHPLPIELVNYCSGDCDMYIISVPSTSMTAKRGYPEDFDPLKLIVSREEHKALIEFCKKHCQPQDEWNKMPELTPKWYLSSYRD